jgi:hypothetical protein
MSPHAFITNMRGFDADVQASPATRKALVQILELLEETQDQVRVLLAANRKLLDVIEALKK